jgi:maltooligosyltrehalose trehalohydrolase
MVHGHGTTESLAPSISRRYPVGVEVVRHSDGDGEAVGAHVRVWAPNARVVELIGEADQSGGAAPTCVPLSSESNGYHSAFVAGLSGGARYRFRLDGGGAFPDPASRWQPDGPHGPSMVIDHSTYEWGDSEWPGVRIEGQVIYELHVGTFTRDGTFRAAIARLPDLVDLGVTVIELMPVADFSGRFGWGYDGVDLYAPSRLYGAPDDLRAFVDAAHRMELAVILDVVYNHLGPDGNYLPKYSSRYFNERPTEWGASINFDGAGAAPVREYFITNARYWIHEFHFDGLRLDATQQIFDESTPNILTEIGAAVRDAAQPRSAILVAENEPQRASLVRPVAAGGSALDALWNDDFHHSARVAASGRSEAYFSGYRGTAQELVAAAKYGYLYQGQWYAWQRMRRGQPALDLPPTAFVNFIQNHDQVANSAAGRRIHQETSPGRWRALTALLLLLPQTPMLFQGQEFAASSPFLYFADHAGELARMVRDGRANFIAQFPSLAALPLDDRAPDPSDPLTFARCKLDWSERSRNAGAVALHRDLLALRRDDPVLRTPRPRRVDGAVLNDHAFALRYFGGEHGDRLLVVNLDGRLHADPLAESLVAPPHGASWRTAFSTENAAYGGWGTPPIDTADDGWWIPAECAALLSSTPTDATPTSR